jgi:hypothetical protein
MSHLRDVSERIRSDDVEFRPSLALGSPAVIEVPVDDRESLPLVKPMRLRAVDCGATRVARGASPQQAGIRGC